MLRPLRAAARLRATTALLVLASACSGAISDDRTRDDRDDGPGQAGGAGGGFVAPPNTSPSDERKQICGDADPLPTRPLLRRLTDRELVNTIRDTLGVTLTAVDELFPATTFGKFSTDTETLNIAYENVRSYFGVADKVVAQLGDLGDFAGGFTPCQDWKSECTTPFVDGLGAKLFRRPLDDRERATFLTLFDAAKTAGDDFASGVALATRAMLQAPQFLYRIENEDFTGARDLAPHELASRLSYMMWGSAPDAALMQAAAEGRLASAEDVAREVARMLDDPRTKETFLLYVSDWLSLHRVKGLHPSPQMYPDFDPALLADMREETIRFFDELWSETGELQQVFTANYTHASPALARLYGLPEQDGFVRHDLADVPDRMGVLTQAAVLGPAADSEDEPKMVFRGHFILKHFLCTEPPPPPADLDAAIAAAKRDAEGKTQRWQAETRAANTSCGGCHASFDPLAYAFEPYDLLGRRRQIDGFGNELRSDGTIPEAWDEQARSFSSTRAFVQLFADLPQVRACMVANLLHFSMGRAFDLSDEDTACLIADLRDRLAAGGENFPNLLGQIAAHPSTRRLQANP